MELTVKDRLKIFIDYLGISQSEFEKKTGLSNGYVNNIRKSIKAEKFDNNIAPVYPELNKLWLLHGSGEMLNDLDIDHIKPKQYAESNDNLSLVMERLHLYKEKIDFYKEKIEKLEEENQQLKKDKKSGIPGQRVSTSK